MKNPVFDRQHLGEYLRYGSMAAVLYTLPMLLFLSRKDYGNFYLIYIGIGLFMCTIFLYAVRLINRPYDGKRSVSMLIAGNLATLAGVAIATLLLLMCFFGFYPNVFSITPTDSLLQDAPSAVQVYAPSELLFLLLLITVFANTAVGAFVSVITAYAGKKNQTRDQPTPLEKHIRSVPNNR